MRRGSSRTTSSRATSRLPTSRCRTAAASYVAAARANARLTAAGSTSRGSGGVKSGCGIMRRGTASRRRGTRRDARGTVHAPHPRVARSFACGSRAAMNAEASGGASVSRSPATISVGWRTPASAPRRSASPSACSAVGQDRRIRRAALEQRVAQRRQCGASLVAALDLQRQEALQRRTIGHAQLVAEARERLRCHRMRPVGAGDEPRRRADEHEPADTLRVAQRPGAARSARRATSRAHRGARRLRRAPRRGHRRPGRATSAPAARCDHARAGRPPARGATARAPAGSARTARRASPSRAAARAGGRVPRTRRAAERRARSSSPDVRDRVQRVGQQVDLVARCARRTARCAGAPCPPAPSAAGSPARTVRARAAHAESAIASASLPTISGWIGVDDGRSVQGSAGRPGAEARDQRHEPRRRASCPSRIASSAARECAGEHRRRRPSCRRTGARSA